MEMTADLDILKSQPIATPVAILRSYITANINTSDIKSNAQTV